MNILHISAQKPDSTGSGIYLSGIINGLKSVVGRQGLVVGIDASDNTDVIIDKFDGKVGIFPVVYNSENLDFNVPGMSDTMPYASTRYRDMSDEQAVKMRTEIIKKLKVAVDEINPDIILCHHLYFITSIVREVFPDKKVVAICHGTCIRQLLSNDFKKDYILTQIPNLDLIYSLHEEQRNKIITEYKVDESKVKVLGSGYDSTVFNNKNYEKNGKIIMSYAGKISFSKGLIPFIQAVHDLEYEQDELELIFAGGGSDKYEMESIVNSGECCRYDIDFIGRVDQYRLSDMLNKSDIFILPSFYEGLPLVILEALACGNYVISTNVPGLREWLGEEIIDSGLIDFVDLPKMESISTPYEEEIPDFTDRLNLALRKAITYRKNNRYNSIDISNLSWNGLSEKLLESLKVL